MVIDLISEAMNYNTYSLFHTRFPSLVTRIPILSPFKLRHWTRHRIRGFRPTSLLRQVTQEREYTVKLGWKGMSKDTYAEETLIDMKRWRQRRKCSGYSVSVDPRVSVVRVRHLLGLVASTKRISEVATLSILLE